MSRTMLRLVQSQNTFTDMTTPARDRQE